jgi:cytosine/adenosine deaminase-related metal-dependent hydrolase
VAPRLFEVATRGGARSLGLQTGEIETGRASDFLTLNLRHPALLEIPSEDLMTAWVLGAGTQAIRRVAVSGRWIP